jgi:hypothetical protein
MVFCVVYSVVCAIKFAQNFWILLAGRILGELSQKMVIEQHNDVMQTIYKFSGGISTSLLFSVFESWYVKQHNNMDKLDPEWISDTFSKSTFANGILVRTAVTKVPT